MILSITFFTLAVVAYSISQLQQHGKLKWSKDDEDFWGSDSWVRKYKFDSMPETVGFVEPPDNWYYRWFKIDYKERFPGSATIFVSLTDGYHLMQLIMKASLSIALAGFTWWAVAWFVGFGILFTATYKWLSR